MCPAFLPIAVEPLWHVLQLPGVTLLWSNFVPDVKLTVLEWHASHEAVVWTWPEGFPAAVFPLWQVEQAPGCTPLWLKFAPEKVVVLKWHVSQASLVSRCLGGLAVALTRLPVE
jgi:hypothetical protein